VKVIRGIAAVSRRAVVRATEAVHHPAVGVTTHALATAFALAAVVNALDIGWPWWVVASVVAVVALGLGWWRLVLVWFALLNLATAFALAAVVNALDIGWPWWVVASVVAVVAAGLSWGVYYLSEWRWSRELERYRALERTWGCAIEAMPHVDYTLPHKRTPPIAVIVGLFAVSLGSLGMSTSLDDSSPGSIVAYAVPLSFGALSFVMGLMLARARRKVLDVIRKNFVGQVEAALTFDTLDTLSLDALVRQRNALLDSGDVSDANNIIVLIRDYYRLREDPKRSRTPPPVTW